MKKNITLLILAAGMGSRFGGLKQVEPMGPSGEFIIDYSVYDAIKAGFTKIVFLIKKENYELFKQTIGKRVEPHIEVAYCFQENNNLPKGIEVPINRTKPLGTAHAILCCRKEINTPFAIINADDFYGRDAFIKASEFLQKKVNDNSINYYGMIGYIVKNTITDMGSVKRGICEVENNKLLKLTESNVLRINGKIIATPLNSTKSFEVSDDCIVSMNMLLFTPSIFKYIEDKFPVFLEKNKSKLDSCEFLIPEVLFQTIEDGYADVLVIKTSATWHGVTYKEDMIDVKNALKDLVSIGEYQKDLWK